MQAAVMQASGEKPAFRSDINALRALCVLLVVAYHVQLRGSGGGYIGVDVFFVISGYLMTRIIWGSLGRGEFRYREFMVARAARIWPALGVLVAVLALLSVLCLPPFDRRLLAEQAAPALVFWSNHFFLDSSGYNTRSADTQWLLHTWSLSVEWQFYMLYPLLLMGAASLKLGRRGVVWLLGALAVASLACQWALGHRHPDSAFFLMPARLWELLAGGLMALLSVPSGAKTRGRFWVAHAGFGLIVVSALWLGVKHVPPAGLSWQLLPPVLGACLVIGARGPDTALARHPVVQALGRWSYSIYLWHWPLIIGLRMTDAFIEFPRLSATGVFVASVGLGACSYRLVESVRFRGSPWAKPALAMCGAMLVTALLLLTDGWRMRGSDSDLSASYRASVKEGYFPDRCSNFMKTAAETQVCPVSKGGASQVLVIGDSHAEHLYPWFMANSAVSVDFFTQAECPPVPRFERMQAGFHCQDYSAAAWLKMASGAYDTLVVAAHWSGIGLDGAPYCHRKAVGAACEVVGLADKQARVRAELKRAIESVLAQGKAVVLLMPTPEAKVRVPERMARERFLWGQAQLRIDEGSIGVLNAWLTPLLDELRGRRGLHLVSLNDKLCRSGSCEVFDAVLKRPIYIDESHFDPVWIAANGGVFAPFVQPR